MTLISTIIADAFRESNVIAVGTTPTQNEQDEALRLLNRYIQSLFGYSAGENFVEIAVGVNNVATVNSVYQWDADPINLYIPDNIRILANLTAPKTLDLNPHPRDGSRLSVADASTNFATYPLTLVGNGRKIEGGLSVVLNVSGTDRDWFYRSDTGNWSKVSDLLTTDVSPFPEEYDDMLSIGLAIRINPRNGNNLDPNTGGLYKELQKQFKARYRQSHEVGSEDALLRLPSNRRSRNYWSSSPDFNRGNTW